MKEFMLLIRNVGDGKAGLSAERHLEFVKACEVYIGKLMANGNLISAQPLQRDGAVVTGTPGAFTVGPYPEADGVLVGYYHIKADSLEDAVKIAEQNPEFAFSSNAKIEVRAIKMKEEATSFVYPQGTPA